MARGLPHCEFRQRATAEVTGLTAAEGKSFYPPLTGQDSFRVLPARGERLDRRESCNPCTYVGEGVRDLHEGYREIIAGMQWPTDAIAVMF